MTKRAPRTRGLKTLLLAAFGLVAAAGAFGQRNLQEPWEREPAWLHFERGRAAFASRDFGQALVYFDRAAETRRLASESAVARLSFALESSKAQAVGDSIQGLLSAFAAEDFLAGDYRRILDAAGPSWRQRLLALRQERLGENHRALVDALLVALEYRPMERFKDSLRALSDELRLLARYPEAEYWKGKVFFMEGELALAERQFYRAFDWREALDPPQFVYTILYELAALHEAKAAGAPPPARGAARGDSLDLWEGVMARILDGERSGDGITLDERLLNSMRESLLAHGFDRFMTLYRIEPGYSLAANLALGPYYLERGRAQALVRSALGVNMLLTRAIALVRERDFDYVWAGLDDFWRVMARHEAAREYLEESGFEKALFTLADALFVAGSRTHAEALWTTLARRAGVPYAAMAASRLANPAGAVRRAGP